MEFGERTRDCSPGHARKEGRHVAKTGASRGFSLSAEGTLRGWRPRTYAWSLTNGKEVTVPHLLNHHSFLSVKKLSTVKVIIA